MYISCRIWQVYSGWFRGCRSHGSVIFGKTMRKKQDANSTRQSENMNLKRAKLKSSENTTQFQRRIFVACCWQFVLVVLVAVRVLKVGLFILAFSATWLALYSCICHVVGIILPHCRGDIATVRATWPKSATSCKWASTTNFQSLTGAEIEHVTTHARSEWSTKRVSLLVRVQGGYVANIRM